VGTEVRLNGSLNVAFDGADEDLNCMRGSGALFILGDATSAKKFVCIAGMNRGPSSHSSLTIALVNYPSVLISVIKGLGCLAEMALYSTEQFGHLQSSLKYPTRFKGNISILNQ
jgi:hypothetical protein